MLHSVILAGLTRTVLNRVPILLVGPITGCPKTLLRKAPQLADSTRLISSILPVHKQMFSESREIGVAAMKNQSVTEPVLAGFFESLPAA